MIQKIIQQKSTLGGAAVDEIDKGCLVNYLEWLYHTNIHGVRNCYVLLDN